jgi:hypothetical protein
LIINIDISLSKTFLTSKKISTYSSEINLLGHRIATSFSQIENGAGMKPEVSNISSRCVDEFVEGVLKRQKSFVPGRLSNTFYSSFICVNRTLLRSLLIHRHICFFIFEFIYCSYCLCLTLSQSLKGTWCDTTPYKT